eukprot:7221038-Heterocapsa_arctica.AAC.1
MDTWIKPLNQQNKTNKRAKPDGGTTSATTSKAFRIRLDAETQELIVETAKLTLQSSRLHRAHAPALQHVALIPQSCPVVQAMDEQNK